MIDSMIIIGLHQENKMLKLMKQDKKFIEHFQLETIQSEEEKEEFDKLIELQQFFDKTYHTIHVICTLDSKFEKNSEGFYQFFYRDDIIFLESRRFKFFVGSLKEIEETINISEMESMQISICKKEYDRS